MLGFLGLSITGRSCSTSSPRRCGWPAGSTLPPGLTEPDVLRRDGPAGRRATAGDRSALLRRGGRLRPRGPGGHAAAGVPLGVRHRLHALPARGRPGRPAGALRVPDAGRPARRACRSPTPRSTTGPARASRPSTWRWRPPDARRCGSAAGVHPHWREVLATFARGTGHEIVDVPLRRRGHRLGRRRRGEAPAARPGRLPELPRGARGPAGRQGRCRPAPARCSSSASTRSRPACCAAGRVGRRRGRRARASRSVRRCRSAARTSACSPAASSTSAGCPADWSARRSTPRAARLRHDPARPRAGHPPGEGLVQRLHQPDADGGDAAMIQLAWLGTAGLRELALRCARGTRYCPRGAAGHRRA